MPVPAARARRLDRDPQGHGDLAPNGDTDDLSWSHAYADSEWAPRRYGLVPAVHVFKLPGVTTYADRRARSSRGPRSTAAGFDARSYRSGDGFPPPHVVVNGRLPRSSRHTRHTCVAR